MFLLVSHTPGRLLPTIRSRCRVIKLHTPGLSDFSAVLSHIAPSIPMADYDALHALAHGSPGYAITVSQYDGVALYRSLLEALAHTPSVEAALALASAMAGKKAADAWGIAKHVLLMAIELMLLAVNMNFVEFSYYLNDMAGQVFVFFILTVAAAESAIGLAILVLLFRNKSSINVDELNTLKG